MIARIAVASAVFSMDKPFDYRIPDSLTLQPGQRVRVPAHRTAARRASFSP